MDIVLRHSYEPSGAKGPATIAVFCDVFRASTTLLTILSKKPQRVFLTNDEETAKAYVARGALLFSEVFRGGFDNSPSQARTADLAGRTIIHKSTNLTNAVFSSPLLQGGNPGRGFIGGLVNLKALISLLQREQGGLCEVVAAAHFGRGTEAVEDSACTAMIASHMRGQLLPEVPRLQEIREKIASKKSRGDYPPHYFEDVEIALQLDLFDFVAEIKIVDDKVMEIVRVGARS